MTDERLLKEIKKLCCSETRNVLYSDIVWVMKRFGFKEESGKGSHMKFRKKGYPPFIVPSHKPFKPIYLKLMCQYLEEYHFWSSENCKQLEKEVKK